MRASKIAKGVEYFCVGVMFATMFAAVGVFAFTHF